ncbi:G-rich sequence factor 1 [Clupea harengus]|uniref:G-rich sequence factor 1 n=1 Tax=Clupea harengus TaxID=7950 RepID=A0A6P3VY47_CLUHA|nr:G-rich sequence factor 1 [Clupea harengus]
MSGHCRAVLISTLFRALGGRQPCSKIFLQNKPSQVLGLLGDQYDRPRYHHWSTSHTRTVVLNVKSTWTSCQRNQLTEAGVTLPFKEEEYPPLPEYDATPQPESKDVFIVRVKGLPWSCKKEDVLEFFSECRIREGVKGIHFMHLRDGRPNGQAFMELETEEDVSKALERHRQYLGPRYIEVFEVTDEQAEAILKGPDPLANDGVVRLRGLPFNSTEKDIIQFFTGLDIVEDGVTLVSNSRGQSIGQAYVQFASPEMADSALEKDKEVMGHRYVEIFPSCKSEITSQRGPRAQEPQAPPPNRSPPLNRPPPANTPHTALEWERGEAQPLRSGRSAASQASVVPIHYVHMRGLPYEATAEDIVKFFGPLRVARIMVEYHSDGKASGEAEVHFRSHKDAVAAMSKDKEYMQNRYIELFLNSSRRAS